MKLDYIRNSNFEYRTRSSPPEVFLWKGVLKIYIKFTGEHPRQSAISITLQSDVIEIKRRHWCSPVILLHIFRTPFPQNTSGELLLYGGQFLLSVALNSNCS